MADLRMVAIRGPPSRRVANVKPAQTLLGVTRLAFPELLIEIEATAAS